MKATQNSWKPLEWVPPLHPVHDICPSSKHSKVASSTLWKATAKNLCTQAIKPFNSV